MTADTFRPNTAELAEWTARNRRARRAYSTRDAELDRRQEVYEARLRREAAGARIAGRSK